MTFVRNFLISFLIALIVFAPLTYFGVNYVVGEVETGLANKDDEDDIKDEDNKIGSTDLTGELPISLAMICRSDNPDYIDPNSPEQPVLPTFPEIEEELPSNPYIDEEELLPRVETANPEKIVDFITLVSVNSASRRAVVTAIPGCLLVEFKGVSMSLSDALYFASLPEYKVDDSYVTDLITSCTGITVDCYDYVDTIEFVRAADSLDYLTVKFPEATTIYDGATRFFPKGENKINSATLLSLIRYENYTNPLLKYQIISAACISILEKGCTPTAFSSFDQTWARISAYMEYDLGKYLTPRSVAEKLLAFSECTVTPVGTTGQFVTIDGVRLFELDRTNTIAQMKEYGG